MLPVVLLVLLAFVIVAAALAWAWWHESLHPSEQERIDLEFERIVGALERPTR